MATSWQPAAVASACTRATTSWGICWTVSIIAVHTSNSSRACVERGAGHVGEVVPGGEHRPVGREDHPGGVAPAGLGERLGQLAHHVERQRVALLRPVEGDRDHVALAADEKVLAHGFMISPHRLGTGQRSAAMPGSAAMSAYLVVNAEITDQSQLDQYGAAVGPTLAGHEFKVLTVFTDPEVLEGSPGERTVIMEFADRAACGPTWYDSPEATPRSGSSVSPAPTGSPSSSTVSDAASQLGRARWPRARPSTSPWPSPRHGRST